jgi:hypothetical protein
VDVPTELADALNQSTGAEDFVVGMRRDDHQPRAVGNGQLWARRSSPLRRASVHRRRQKRRENGERSDPERHLAAELSKQCTSLLGLSLGRSLALLTE